MYLIFFLIAIVETLFALAMLATQWNCILAEDKLAKNGIIVLKKYITNSVHNRRIVIIVEIDVLLRDMEMRMGEPANIEPNQPTGALVHQRQDSFEGADHMNSANTSTKPNLVGQSHSGVSANPYNSYTGPSVANFPQRGEESSVPIFPIKSINPYQNKWTIKARITNKSEIKTWKNVKGDGKLFSMDLIDDSGEIRVTAFNDTVDKFYDMIDVNKVYYISKAQVKAAKRQFSSIRNEYELTLDVNSTIQLVSHKTLQSLFKMLILSVQLFWQKVSRGYIICSRSSIQFCHH